MADFRSWRKNSVSNTLRFILISVVTSTCLQLLLVSTVSANASGNVADASEGDSHGTRYEEVPVVFSEQPTTSTGSTVPHSQDQAQADERSASENKKKRVSRISSPYSGSSRILMEPLGIWKQARRMVQEGVHRFRESLHEGVKVAQMLKEDVDEGVSHLIPNRKSRNHNNVETETLHSALSEEVATMKGDAAAFDKIKDKSQETETEYPHKNDEISLNSFSEQELNRVVQSLGQQLPREGMFGGMLKFIGVDSSSVGIILLNILIFVAEMVTSSLLGKDANSIADTRMLKANLLEWVVTGRNEKVSKIISDAQSHELPEHIIHTLQKRTGNKTSCVQLLICKMSPFIWGVQKTVEKEFEHHKNGSSDQRHSNGRSQEYDDESAEKPRSLTSYFTAKYLGSIWSQLLEVAPNRDNFLSFGDTCEKKFPSCKLLKFPKANATRNSTKKSS